MGIRITYIRAFSFYHGSFITSPMPGSVIYFADIKMGLIAVPRDLQGNNSFFRFTGAEVPPGSFYHREKIRQNSLTYPAARGPSKGDIDEP